MTIRFCTDFAKENYASAIKKDLLEITDAMTPKQFIKLIGRRANAYRIVDLLGYSEYAQTFLGRAATHAPQLIDPIVRLRGTKTLDLGTPNGMTPLIQVVAADIPNERKLRSMTRLIELRADVNRAATYGTTPLSLTLEINNIALAKLLLANGAATAAPNELFESADSYVRKQLQMHPERLALAQREIEDEKRTISDAVLNAIPHMPSDLGPIVAGYAGHPLRVEQVQLPPWPKPKPRSCSVM